MTTFLSMVEDEVDSRMNREQAVAEMAKEVDNLSQEACSACRVDILGIG